MTNEEARIELLEEYKIFLEGCGLENEEYLNQQMKDNDELRKVVEANRMAIKALEQQTSDDCISRQAVLDAVRKNTFRLTFSEEQGCEGHVLWNVKAVPSDTIEEALLELPPVTPKPKIGKWIILDECANEGVYCSECHKKVFKLEFSHTMKWRNFKYCPNCGAKMEVEE